MNVVAAAGLALLTVTSCRAGEGKMRMIILSNNSATMIDNDVLIITSSLSLNCFTVASLLTKHQDDHGGRRMIKLEMFSMVVTGSRSCSIF